jgi:hypothetical protein
MSDETKDMRKQLSTYADAITAFATAQLVGFILLMTHGDCFTKNVLSGIGYAVGVGVAVNLCYLSLVILCHPKDDTLGKEEGVIRQIRYAIIVVDLFATALIPLAISYGWQHGQFFIDCKASC